MTAEPPFVRRLEDGLRVAVRAAPGAARDAFGGVHVDAAGIARLAVKVRAAAQDNAANRALAAFIAKRLGLARSAASVVSGHRARCKTVVIRCDPVVAGELEERLRKLARESSG